MAWKRCGPPTVNITVGTITVKDHTSNAIIVKAKAKMQLKSGAIILLVTVFSYCDTAMMYIIRINTDNMKMKRFLISYDILL